MCARTCDWRSGSAPPVYTLYRALLPTIQSPFSQFRRPDELISTAGPLTEEGAWRRAATRCSRVLDGGYNFSSTLAARCRRWRVVMALQTPTEPTGGPGECAARRLRSCGGILLFAACASMEPAFAARSDVWLLPWAGRAPLRQPDVVHLRKCGYTPTSSAVPYPKVCSPALNDPGAAASPPTITSSFAHSRARPCAPR